MLFMMLSVFVFVFFFFLMIRRPPRSTRTDTLFPYTTLFRSAALRATIDSLVASGLLTRFEAGSETIYSIDPAKHPMASYYRIIVAHHFLRSEEHTSELQSLMRISYAVFCLKKKTNKTQTTNISDINDSNIHYKSIYTNQ